MRLYLAQHGLAVDENEDPTRPLSAQGREDTTRTAGFLSLFEKPRPQWVGHSGKLRAQQTAEMFAEAWGGIDVVEQQHLSPNDDPSVWQEELTAMAGRGDVDSVMLVGHLPHLQRLAGLLICQDTEQQPALFRNSGVLCLREEQGAWSVQWLIYPALFYGE